MDIIDKIKESGVSVDNLSKATGIPTSRIYKWFSKKAEPKYADTKLLEDFLKVGKVKPDVTTPNTSRLDDLIEGNKHLSLANKDLAAANLELTLMLKTNSNNNHQNEYAQACLERIAEQGSGVQLHWKTKEDGLKVLGKLLSETVKKKNEVSR